MNSENYNKNVPYLRNKKVYCYKIWLLNLVSFNSSRSMGHRICAQKQGIGRPLRNFRHKQIFHNWICARAVGKLLH